MFTSNDVALGGQHGGLNLLYQLQERAPVHAGQDVSFAVPDTIQEDSPLGHAVDLGPDQLLRERNGHEAPQITMSINELCVPSRGPQGMMPTVATQAAGRVATLRTAFGPVLKPIVRLQLQLLRERTCPAAAMAGSYSTRT